MTKFDVSDLFGINVDFPYFDPYELLSVLKLESVVSNSPRLINLLKRHDRKDRIVTIAIRQIILSELKEALNGVFLPFNSDHYGLLIMSSEADRRYEAEEKFLLICFSLALGKSVVSVKRLHGTNYSKLARDFSIKGKSLYVYIRRLLDDSTRQYILDYQSGNERTSRRSINNGAQGKSRQLEQSGSVEMAPFSKEVSTASALIDQGISLLKEEVKKAASGKPLNVNTLLAYCQKLIASYDRNNHALLAIRHIQNSENYLAQHCLGCAILACHLSKSLSLEVRYIEVVTMAALIFDLGRFKLPVAMAKKTGKLTEAELMLTRKHLDFSEALLTANLDIPKVVYQMLWEHHERLDGTGYPQGKVEGEISVYGKIGAIVDAYDSLTSEQSHKTALTPVDALLQMKKERGVAFDIQLLDVFIASLGPVPVGTCVELSNGRLGFVLTLNKSLEPSLVRQVYSLSSNTYISAADLPVDKADELSIRRVISPQKYLLSFVDHIS